MNLLVTKEGDAYRKEKARGQRIISIVLTILEGGFMRQLKFCSGIAFIALLAGCICSR